MTRKFWKGAVLLSAALVTISGTARAEQECSNATLKGLYGFSLRGEFIGFFDADGNPQRIRNPDIIDAVFIQKFDGTGAFTRSDYVSSDGFKRPGLTDRTTGFDTGETGTYTVFPNCTGIMHITFPAPIASTIIEIRFALTEGGHRLHGVVSHQEIAGPFTALDEKTTCGPTPACNMRAQESVVGEKFDVGGGDR
jgi:hypothetical protein